MAKILMIQIHVAPYAGTAYLNAAAKTSGHEFILHIGDEIEGINEKIKNEAPDLIGFSCMSNFYKDILLLTKAIKKKFEIPIILGGSHPTLFPDIINEESIDIICRGEGEFALIDILNAIENKKPYNEINNLWVKKANNIYKNDIRPLAEPLDNLPLIDWSCYENTIIAKSSPPIAFLIRGCPYSCSYCFNAATRKMYTGKGSYIRYFSVERSILEIKQALKVFPPSPVLFTSDSFGFNLKWTEELFTEYEKITNLPFTLLIRPELATEEVIKLLSNHNCVSVALGVESGSERVRKEILNRCYDNKLLLNVAKRLHKYNIKFRAYNLIGLPTETDEELWETIEINIKMKTDFPRAAIFTPYPDTKIVEIAKDRGYLDHDFSFENLPKSVFNGTILKNLDKNKILSTLYFFQTIIIFPKSKKFIKWVIKTIKPNALFKLFFYLIYAYLHKKSENRAFIPYIKYLISNRKSI